MSPIFAAATRVTIIADSLPRDDIIVSNFEGMFSKCIVTFSCGLNPTAIGAAASETGGLVVEAGFRFFNSQSEAMNVNSEGGEFCGTWVPLVNISDVNLGDFRSGKEISVRRDEHVVVNLRLFPYDAHSRSLPLSVSVVGNEAKDVLQLLQQSMTTDADRQRLHEMCHCGASLIKMVPAAKGLCL
jgi:predicted sugar kinase